MDELMNDALASAQFKFAYLKAVFENTVRKLKGEYNVIQRYESLLVEAL